MNTSIAGDVHAIAAVMGVVGGAVDIGAAYPVHVITSIAPYFSLYIAQIPSNIYRCVH